MKPTISVARYVSKMLLCHSLIFSLAFLTPYGAATANDVSDVNVPSPFYNIEASVESGAPYLSVDYLRSELESFFGTNPRVSRSGSGPSGVLDWVFDMQDDMASKGINFARFRDEILKQTGGKAADIHVAIPEGKNQDKVIDYMNTLLRESGLADVLHARGVVDPQMRKINEVMPDQARSYRLLKAVRILLMVSIGYFASYVDAAARGEGLPGEIAAKMKKVALSVGTVVAFLETQFTVFSHWWNEKFWSKDETINMMTRFNQGVRGLTSVQSRIWNRALRVLSKPIVAITSGLAAVKKNVAWNFFWNWMYGVFVSATAVIASVSFGLTDAPATLGSGLDSAMGVLKLSIGFNIVVFATFSAVQMISGVLNVTGRLSEFMRIMLESTGALFMAIWRVVALIGEAGWLPWVMQGLYGAFVTSFLVGRTYADREFTRQLAARFEALDRGMPYMPVSKCRNMLLGLREAMPLGPTATFGSWAKGIARWVRNLM